MNLVKVRNSIIAIGIIAGLIIGMAGVGTFDSQRVNAASKYRSEVRGTWVSFCDFASLGLKDKSRYTYTKNVKKFVLTIKKNNINRIYFHVRAFDDAAWKSKTFKASGYLTSRASSKKTAAKTYSYDSLKIFISEAHKQRVKVEAYMNPYRITYTKFLNPGSKYSTDRINRAVDELKAYNLDGFHFDDYFYHSKKYYMTPDKGKKYYTYVTGKKFKRTPSAGKKRRYVNNMLKSVNKNVHEKSNVVFGVSPAGNYENCMAGGADVKTWLGKRGKTYVDYVIPQIYWTNKWGRKGKYKMYTERLNRFTGLWKNKKVKLYIGLASYMTGVKTGGDRGWSKSSTNLKKQVSELRDKGSNGYVLFEGKDFYRKSAAKELGNLRTYVSSSLNMRGISISTASKKVKKIYARSIRFKYKSLTIKKKHRKTLKLYWMPVATNQKYIKYSSSNKSVATVSKNGVVKARQKGRVTITAKTKNGKVARCRIRVK